MELSSDALRRITMGFGVLALALFGAVLIADCGGSDSPKAASGPANFERLLAFIPDTEEARRGVMMVDHVRFRDIVKLEVPPGVLDRSAQEQYMLELQARLDLGNKQLDTALHSIRGAGTMWAGLDEYGRTAITVGNIGYGPANIDGEVYAGPVGKRYVALRGRFDPDLIKGALAACKGCPVADVRPYKGVSYYSWGKDLEENPRTRLRAGFDEKGRSGRMVFERDHILRTEWTAGIEQMIDTPKGSSLARNADFKLVARKLDAMESYRGYITTETQSRERVTAPSQVQALKPYRLLGIGQGSTGSAPYTSIVLVHDSADAARVNVPLLKDRIASTSSVELKKPWSEVYTAVEVWSEGNLLLAKLQGYRGFDKFFTDKDPLLIHD